MSRVPVMVLGATGLVGQRLVQLLDDHPQFSLAEVAGSSGRAGQAYGESVRWALESGPPESAMSVQLSDPWKVPRSRLVLSALPATAAGEREIELAERGHVVCTNASAHRMRLDVPLLVPEVNSRRLALAGSQPWSGVGGALIANPNCVVAGLALALAPIDAACGIESATVVTLQALSGAGLGGPAGLGVVGNVVPDIPGEEEKVAAELQKVLETSAPVAVAVNRVPVIDGHMAHVFLRLSDTPEVSEVRDLLSGYRRPECLATLPSLPEVPIVLRDEPDRPQPRLDAGASRGMAVSVGRIRAAHPHDLALTLVVHNTIRGAAGACLANAELALATGMLG